MLLYLCTWPPRKSKGLGTLFGHKGLTYPSFGRANVMYKWNRSTHEVQHHTNWIHSGVVPAFWGDSSTVTGPGRLVTTAPGEHPLLFSLPHWSCCELSFCGCGWPKWIFSFFPSHELSLLLSLLCQPLSHLLHFLPLLQICDLTHFEKV